MYSVHCFVGLTCVRLVCKNCSHLFKSCDYIVRRTHLPPVVFPSQTVSPRHLICDISEVLTLILCLPGKSMVKWSQGSIFLWFLLLFNNGYLTQSVLQSYISSIFKNCFFHYSSFCYRFCPLQFSILIRENNMWLL